MDSTRTSLLRDVQDPRNSQRWMEFKAVYEPMITAFVRKQQVPWHEVDELVQQVFIKLWEGIASYRRGEARFHVWLYQVVRHAVYDWHRRQNKDARLREAAREQGRAAPIVLPEEPDAEWEHDFRRRVFECAVAAVRPEIEPATWACFEQHIVLARPAAEVARELDRNVNAVYTSASRVLGKVRLACVRLTEEWRDES
jgi:RNA polymerase sigma-70 factor (ECF subfamily)